MFGRADDQLKVRGYRVEPAEVARALTNHPRVKEAAVGLRTIAEDLDTLVGYVLVDGAPVTAGELARHLRSLLPSYMVPSRFVFLDALPLTPTGKVEQRLLSQLALPSTEAEDQTGKSPIEPVQAIWERVLGHDELELDDDFFDVGGDSLLVTWVVTELGQLVGQELELSLLLQDSTIAGLARIPKERGPGRPLSSSPCVPVRRSDRSIWSTRSAARSWSTASWRQRSSRSCASLGCAGGRPSAGRRGPCSRWRRFTWRSCGRFSRAARGSPQGADRLGRVHGGVPRRRLLEAHPRQPQDLALR